MHSPAFTVLLPINRPPELLPLAIESVLAQKDAIFELFVVCDGAPISTIECAKSYARRDKRIHVFPFEKGERHGEAHRHSVLKEAKGPFVAQLGDDDLWFPDHLSTLGRLLERVDFGNLIQVELAYDTSIQVHLGDLADLEIRRRMLNEKFNFFGPTVAGYRLSAYKRLPIGWSPAPADLWTDLHMWRKFLIRDDLTFGTSFSIQSVKFSAEQRKAMSLSERAVEIANWVRFFADARGRDEFIECGFKAALRYLDATRKKSDDLLAESERSLASTAANLRALEERYQAVIEELNSFQKTVRAD